MVISVYEKEKIKRLNEKNIVIETIFYNPNNSKGEVFVRSTDGKMNDNINYKAIKEKRFFLNDECIFVEKNFNSSFLYNIINYEDENGVIKCPNCGNSGKVSEFIDRCPYCGTIFNFGLNDINNSKKQLKYHFHFKYDLKVFLIVLIINSLFLFLLFLLMAMPIVVSIVFSFLMSFDFSAFLSLIIISIISSKKYSNNPDYGLEQYKNIIWKISRDEKVFFNNFKAELMINLFEQKNLIDFEITDYCNIDFLSEDEVIVTCKVREIFYNNEINVFENTYKIKTKHNDINKKNNIVIKCLGCGSSMDITQKKCNYCERINDFNNEWIIETVEKI